MAKETTAMPVTAVKQEPQPDNLRQKLNMAQTQVERVEKRGENTAQRYRYAKAEDIIEAARRVLSHNGIAFLATEDKIENMPEYTTKSGATMSVVRVTMRFTLFDTDSDDKLEFLSTGEGQDAGDKAIYKARTGAIKYGLTQTLLMSTGDDPEDDTKGGGEERVQRTTRGQQEAVACPKCGNVGSMVQKRDGTWACWASKGGCEAVFGADEPVNEPPRSSAQAQPKATSKANGGPKVQPINERPEPEEIVGEDFDSAPKGERVVVAPDQLAQLKSLIAQATNPSETEMHIKRQCAVGDLSDLTPQQAEWMIETLQRRLQQREQPTNGGKRPRK